MSDDAYKQSGVDIDAGQRAVALMREAVHATYNAAVLSETGNFGGLYDLSGVMGLHAPVLVASTDGVGTKTKVAAALKRWDGIGRDLVNHCVNDILVQGARPLFFLDYVASSRLVPEQIAAIVTGMAQACQQAGCALLGGETAEMPGVYQPGEVDVVGTVVGIVDRAAIIDGSRIQAGDVVLGLPASGLHTNGYSLARRVLAELDWIAPRDDLDGVSLGEVLLRPHRSYRQSIDTLRAAGIDLKGLAHITGGGLVDNPPRILPDGLSMRLDPASWTVPVLFTLIQRAGNISDADMRRTFNMGLGMLAVIPAQQAQTALNTLEKASIVGEITSGASKVVFID